MANDNVFLELVRLLLVVKHPDEEEPQASLGNSFKITIEQTFLVGQLQRLKFGIIDIITASFIIALVKHLGADVTQLQLSDPVVELVLVPPMLLDSAERSNVSTGRTEHGLGALHRSEEFTALQVKLFQNQYLNKHCSLCMGMTITLVTLLHPSTL